MAAEKALFQTKYKFRTLPSTLANAEWNRRTNLQSISDSDDNNNESLGYAAQKYGLFTVVTLLISCNLEYCCHIVILFN